MKDYKAITNVNLFIIMENELHFIKEGISKNHFAPPKICKCGNEILTLNRNLKNKNIKFASDAQR